VNQAIKASFAAMLIVATFSSSGDPTIDKSERASAVRDQQTFDESHGALLKGDAAREMAEMCGAKSESKEWKVAPIDIRNLEQELAPLLTADLKQVGSSATPNQYYRQYAAGQFEMRDAIFVNGFHESYLSSLKDTSWQHRVVSVLDGGDHYWCAIYIKGMKRHFVTYKKEGSRDGATHVSFNGVA
jgi:hypothetical protein